MTVSQNIELTVEDLLGYSIADIKCRQCTRFCACHINRMLDGEALFLCGRKDEVRQIIAAKERMLTSTGLMPPCAKSTANRGAIENRHTL